jgi:hypothetical protein
MDIATLKSKAVEKFGADATIIYTPDLASDSPGEQHAKLPGVETYTAFVKEPLGATGFRTSTYSIHVTERGTVDEEARFERVDIDPTESNDAKFIRLLNEEVESLRSAGTIRRAWIDPSSPQYLTPSRLIRAVLDSNGTEIAREYYLAADGTLQFDAV